MSYILVEELDKMISEYKNATTRTEKLIRHRLNTIVNLYKECNADEREFADEIAIEFCKVISLLKEQHHKELTDATNRFFSDSENVVEKYISDGNNESDLPYKIADDLLYAFRNHFKDKMNKVTLNDYISRINTFAYSAKYLHEMLLKGDLDVKEIRMDPVLFTYNNIELIIARFNTKNEEGKSIKQRLNIRSALKKLNEFKLKQKSNI